MRLNNFLSSLKNSISIKAKYVDIYTNKNIRCILGLLYKLGYLSGFTFLNSNLVRIFLKYKSSVSVISNIHPISKCANKIYIKNKHVSKYFKSQNTGFVIFSSDKGYLTDIELYFYRTGGEPLFYIS